MTVVLEKRPELKPEDFQAQLYMTALQGSVELTERVPVVYGQKEVTLPVVCRGLADDVMVFDREIGGDYLIRGTVRWVHGPIIAHPLDIIVFSNIQWP